MNRWLSVFVMPLGLITASCDQSPNGGSPLVSSAAHTNRQTFQVRGVVISLKPREKQVEIKHEEIPGFMPGMTMPFDVKDTNELAGLEPGDAVSFRMVVTDTEGWIENLSKVARKAAPASSFAASGAGGSMVLSSTNNSLGGEFRLVRDAEPLEVGDLLPEYRFTNQFGREITTSQFKGQALAITFLFTRCPFPNFCPLMANHFAEVQQKLMAMQGGPTNWHLLTISFDPDFDTPAVLKSYAEFHRYEPRQWDFATGNLVDLTAIAEQFGLTFYHDDTGGITHNLRTAVISSNGRVQRIFQGNSWASDDLLAEMVKAARP